MSTDKKNTTVALKELFQEIKISDNISDNNMINVSSIEIHQSRFYYINDLKDQKKLELISFNHNPDSYGIILVPKEKWPFIYTLNESILNLKDSYYKGDYCDSIKKLINDIRETFDYLKDQIDPKEIINFNMIVFGFKVSIQVVNYLIDMLSEIKEIIFDIKVREIYHLNFSKSKEMNVKYNINHSPHHLFVYGPDEQNNKKSEIIYL